MYIDPSATSYIIQIIAAIVITCGVFVGAFWGKIKAAFQKKKIERMEKQLLKEQEQKTQGKEEELNDATRN